jgi:hypothetical protein
MGRIVTRILGGLLLLLLVFYACDWAVWMARRLAGAGLGTVTVQKVTSAALKKNKVEFYFDGEEDRTCPVSLFPQFRNGGLETPCWYLRRNPTITTEL